MAQNTNPKIEEQIMEDVIMTIKKIWFDNDFIYGEDESGRTLKQSLIWYPRLKEASDEERQNYRVGYDGLHWRSLDEDVSFESFEYDDAEPTPLQKFFLTHRELNVAEFAKQIGINATLLRNYINGFKKPSKAREQEILQHIHALGAALTATSF
jgi:hypothetical protein